MGRNLVVGVTGLDILNKCSLPLAEDTLVVICTLECEKLYQKAPWLCIESTIYQRKYELLKAFSHFGLKSILFLDYSMPEDVEVGRLLAQLQMRSLLYSVNSLYYDRDSLVLESVCDVLVGIPNKIGYSMTNLDLFGNDRKEKKFALLELKEHTSSSPAKA